MDSDVFGDAWKIHSYFHMLPSRLLRIHFFMSFVLMVMVVVKVFVCIGTFGGCVVRTRTHWCACDVECKCVLFLDYAMICAEIDSILVWIDCVHIQGSELSSSCGKKKHCSFFLPSLFIVPSLPPKVITYDAVVAVVAVAYFIHHLLFSFDFVPTPRCTLSVTLIRFCVFILFSSILLLLLLGFVVVGVEYLVSLYCCLTLCSRLPLFISNARCLYLCLSVITDKQKFPGGNYAA